MKIATLISALILPITIYARDYMFDALESTNFGEEGYGSGGYGLDGVIIIVIIFFYVFYRIYEENKEKIEGVVGFLWWGVIVPLLVSSFITEVIAALLGEPFSLLVLGIVFIVIHALIYLFS